MNPVSVDTIKPDDGEVKPEELSNKDRNIPDEQVVTEEDKESNESWNELIEIMGGVDRLVSSVERRLSWVSDICTFISRDDLRQEAMLAIWQSWEQIRSNDEAYLKYLSFLEGDVDPNSPSIIGGYISKNAHWKAANQVGRVIGRKKMGKDSSKLMGIKNTYTFSDYDSDNEDGDPDSELEEIFGKVFLMIDKSSVDEKTTTDFFEYFGKSIRGFPAQLLRKVLLEESFNLLSDRLIRGKGQENPEKTKQLEKAAFYTLFIENEAEKSADGDYRPRNIKESLSEHIRSGRIPQEIDFEKQYHTFKRACQRVTSLMVAYGDNILSRVEERLKPENLNE